MKRKILTGELANISGELFEGLDDFRRGERSLIILESFSDFSEKSVVEGLDFGDEPDFVPHLEVEDGSLPPVFQ